MPLSTIASASARESFPHVLMSTITPSVLTMGINIRSNRDAYTRQYVAPASPTFKPGLTIRWIHRSPSSSQHNPHWLQSPVSLNGAIVGDFYPGSMLPGDC